jgi:hypothetical protein
MKRSARDQVTTYILITYALAQAILSLLMLFDVVQGETLIAVSTSVALVLYVAANELIGRPARRDRGASTDHSRTDVHPDDQVAGDTGVGA